MKSVLHLEESKAEKGIMRGGQEKRNKRKLKNRLGVKRGEFRKRKKRRVREENHERKKPLKGRVG